jgi:choline monooxygenase
MTGRPRECTESPTNARELGGVLPPRSYTSEEFFALESERVFARHWVFVAFAHDLDGPRRAVPVRVAGRSLLILRDDAGELRAFHNLCRHRGLELVEHKSTLGRTIVCPYHGWSYDLDGTLRACPFFGGPGARDLPSGFDRSAHGLSPVPVAQWFDWIFVNLGGGAPPLAEVVGPIATRLPGVALGDLVPVASLELGEVRANWKLLMENFIEPYHVPVVHRMSTQQPLASHFVIEDPGCLGCGIDLEDAARAGPAQRDVLAVSSRYLTAFPNFVLAHYHPDEVGVHLNLPTGPQGTRQRRVIYLPAEAARNDERIRLLVDLWSRVHAEDHAICERLQQGRNATADEDTGLLSPVWESAVRSFQDRVRNAMDRAGDPARTARDVDQAGPRVERAPLSPATPALDAEPCGDGRGTVLASPMRITEEEP